MTTGRRLLVALFTILPLAVARARADSAFHAPVVGRAEIAALQQEILASRSVRLEDFAWRNDPAPFDTRRPCRVRVEAGQFGKLFGGDGVAPFAKVLGVAGITGPDTVVRSCRGDSLRFDSVVVTFGQGSGAVVALLDLTTGQCTWRWNDSLSLVTLVPRADVMGLVTARLPDDSLVAGIRDCVLLRSSTSPRLGEFVYVETLPEAVTKVPPSYPEDARRAGVDGTVMVQALVNKSGEVAETIVLRSIPMLDRVAVDATEQWAFKPAQANGKPVAVWVAIPVKFTLH